MKQPNSPTRGDALARRIPDNGIRICMDLYRCMERCLGMPVEHTELLRRMAISDARTLSRVLGGSDESETLDQRTAALVRIAALIALDAGEPSYDAAIDAAHLAGAEDEEILGVAAAIRSVVGAVISDAAVPMLHSDLEGQRPTT